MNEKLCRRLCLERSEGFCERCCVYGPLTMHHRKKRGQGGLWTPDNIVAVCGDGVTGCHGWFEHNPDKAAGLGWHVRPWEDSTEVPVFWRGSTWVLLKTDGSVEHVGHGEDLPIRVGDHGLPRD